MKDTMLTVSFKLGELRIYHKSLMGSLNDLFDLGNAYRQKVGKKALPLTAWIQRDDTKEYIEYLGDGAIERKRGKNGGTYAHLKILLDAATSLSPEFKDEVYETFISGKLGINRELGGEYFKDMNSLLDIHAEDLLGKPAHKGHRITIATMIRKKVLPEGHPGWNCADVNQMHHRQDIEDKVSSMLRLGVVKDWDHLKELIDKL